ncbi:MAG: hypothetical protein WCF96_05905 [Eubacteriales bacterium]
MTIRKKFVYSKDGIVIFRDEYIDEQLNEKEAQDSLSWPSIDSVPKNHKWKQFQRIIKRLIKGY